LPPRAKKIGKTQPPQGFRGTSMCANMQSDVHLTNVSFGGELLATERGSAQAEAAPAGRLKESEPPDDVARAKLSWHSLRFAEG